MKIKQTKGHNNHKAPKTTMSHETWKNNIHRHIDTDNNLKN
jgi:hypothetical protein